MKQLLFLLLFPCLALAQYTGNAGQKITLGEQTTADGLVFRGVASIDTVTATSKITRANKQDTSAFLLLDTTTNLLWHYKTASNGWIQAGGSTFDTTTLNLVSRFAAKQNTLTLTTTGTSGAATLTGATLNIPQYSGGGGVDSTAIKYVNTYGTQTVNGAKTFTTAPTFSTALLGGSGGTGITTFGAANRIPYAASTTALTTNANLTYTIAGGLSQLGTGEQYFTLGSTNGIYSGIQFKSNSGNNTLFHNGTGTGVFGIGGGGQGQGANKIAAFYGGISIGINYMNTAVPANSMIVEGNVGLGTITSPSTVLHIGKVGNEVVIIEGTNFDSYLTIKNNTTTGTGIKFQDTNQSKNIYYKEGKFTFGGGGQVPSNLTSWGNLSVGDDDIAAPANGIRVKGNARFASTTSVTDLRTDGDGQLFNGSDFNLKNSIDTINFGLLDVMKLKPVSFNWNNESRNISEYKAMGFIAQDVMDVIPNAASTMGDGDMQVDYNAIVATLTKAIQEQNALIKALEQRILILENK